MKIYKELNLSNFGAWSGAINTLDRIKRENKIEELECYLEELYPDGINETTLNDILWFESDSVFERLGIRTENQIEEEINELEEQLQDLLNDFEVNSEGATEEEKVIIYESDYESDIDELKEQIQELQEELNNI